MLRRRISTYGNKKDDSNQVDDSNQINDKVVEVTFDETHDIVEVSSGPSTTDEVQTESGQTKREQAPSSRTESNKPPRRSSESSGGRGSRQDAPKPKSNIREGRPSGDKRYQNAPKIAEEDWEEDYTDTGTALPGDVVGIAEEFKAGNNTYKRGGKIIATTTGIIRENRKTRIVSVIPATSTPPTIKVGDTVIGKVFRVKDSVILLDIATKKGAGDRKILTSDFGEIHVSNISSAYIKDTRREYSQFDIVKAKVIDADTMRLSTADNDCGVLKALCSNCLAQLNLVDKKLGCPVCGNIETRKISSDYGTGTI